MTDKCKVSIIMPSLNVADYIDECIQSAINQTIDNFEIICIDAGSTDGTWEKLSKYEADNENVTLIHSDIKSYGYQVNLGIHKANGEYIAILETDDYVEPDMYEFLYNLGIEYNLDLVKADYDNFITFADGERAFTRVKLWDKEPERYNCVIDPRQMSYLYAYDYSIWKGIYRRQFLLENNIVLNESKGAAYQDIGFVQLMMACCKRAYYSDKSFYRYRTDREMSSVNSVHGLAYSYQEFDRLLNNSDINNKLVNSEALYRHMAHSFRGELIKTLQAVDFNMDSEHIKPYYEWFSPILKKALNTGVLQEGRYPDDLTKILEDYVDYVDVIKQDYLSEKQYWESILNKCRNEKVVIFGAGQRGHSTCRRLKLNGINIQAICDNNDSMWHNSIYGVRVAPPEECVNKYKDCVFIVTSKYYKDEIKKQLIESGIDEDNILF